MIGAVCAAAFALSPVASAEISQSAIEAFNAAYQANDQPRLKSAAAALAAEVVANPADAQSANAGFESAWALCRLGACADALAPARVSAAATPGTDTIAQPTRNLMMAYAAWKADGSKSNTKTLDAALEAVVTSPASALSVTAFRERYNGAIREKDHRNARDLTGFAKAHFSAAGPDAAQFALEAGLVNLSLDFAMKPHVRQQEAMIHLLGETDRLRRQQGENAPEWSDHIYWYAEAWTLAMGAYFDSTSRPSVSDAKRETILSGYTKDLSAAAGPETEDDGVRTCKGSLDMTPRMAYPRGAASKGMFGSVIVRFSLENGAVKDPVVLASVPDEGFKAKAVQIVSQWRYVPSEDPAKAGCDLSNTNTVVPLVFVLD